MSGSYQYGKFDRFLHWFMALNIFATLVFAKGLSSLPDAQKVIEYGNHGVSVTTILIFLIVRVLWRVRKGFASFPSAMTQIQRMAAGLVHRLLYLAFFAQIVIGIFLASTTSQEFIAAGYGINYTSFGLLSKDYHETMLSLHIGMYWFIIVLLVIHVVAALKHHFWDKDDVLRNMLPFVKRE